MILWKQEESKIRQSIVDNVNLKDLAKSYGVSFQRIYQVCNYLNIDCQKFHKERTRIYREIREEKKLQVRINRRELSKQNFLSKYSYITEGMCKRRRENKPLSTKGCSKKIIAARKAATKYREVNALNCYCRNLLGRALKMGYISRGICSCGNKDTQGHHTDYHKPFEVTWYCIKCHCKEHIRLNRI